MPRTYKKRKSSKGSMRLKRLENLAKGELKSKYFRETHTFASNANVANRFKCFDITSKVTAGTGGDAYIGRELHIKSVQVNVSYLESSYTSVAPYLYAALVTTYNPSAVASTLAFTDVFAEDDGARAKGGGLMVDQDNFGWVMASTDPPPGFPQGQAGQTVAVLKKTFKIPMKVRFEASQCLQNKIILVICSINGITGTDQFQYTGRIKFYDY